ncbi:MAG: HlyD family efflux transporter periplasmic adaptor subunit [Saprospiraceae bacterium]
MKKLFNPLVLIFSILVIQIGCKDKNKDFDATGLFETDEVVVSSEVNGRLIDFNIEEGSTIAKDSVIGHIDPLSLELQKEQIEASISAISKKNIPLQPQIQILEAQFRAQSEQINSIKIQLNTAKTEKIRIEKLVKGDAMPGKQLDDINAQIELLEQQIKALQSQNAVVGQQIKSQSILISSQNSGINSEKLPLEKRKELAMDQLSKTNIKNPVQGTVLSKYTNAGEIITMAKPLYKIADLNMLKLKAYITGSQLSKIKLNDKVKVFTDFGSKEVREYTGTIVWISDKAEFTPKTIQTKEERANLVYAIKVKVENDGYLKLGMYGEVKL